MCLLPTYSLDYATKCAHVVLRLLGLKQEQEDPCITMRLICAAAFSSCCWSPAVLISFSQNLVSQQGQQDIIRHWMRECPANMFREVIVAFQQFITIYVNEYRCIDDHVASATKVGSVLLSLAEECTRLDIVSKASGKMSQQHHKL